MKRTIKIALAALACTLTAGTAQSQTREAVQIIYTDGITDYIPASDIGNISFEDGVDTESQLYKTVNQTYDLLKAYNSLYNSLMDFGYATIMLALDSQTEDMPSMDNGYNWFRYWYKYATRGKKNTGNTYMWLFMYNTISEAKK